jgi:predicted small secreted protein
MIKTAAILVAIIGLAGCNTVSGAGKDMSSAGHAVIKAAKPVH